MKNLFSFSLLFFSSLFSFTDQEVEKIGDKIWKNECNQSIEKLTYWNVSEPFPSFGIGHFIWFPEGKELIFEETFPELLDFFKTQNIALPSWLQTKKCPWTTKEAFDQNFHSEKMQALRALLLKTKKQQALFITQRLENNFSKILNSLDKKDQEKVQKIVQSLNGTPQGSFALIDYVNFKGLGTSVKETYQNQGWGLKQVLLAMASSEDLALKNFVNAAKKILLARTQNAPKEKEEKKFLKGWYRRLDSYLESF